MGLLYLILFRYLNETLGENKYIETFGRKTHKLVFQRRGHGAGKNENI